MSGTAKRNLSLELNLVGSEIEAIKKDFMATEKQILNALKRASNITARRLKAELTKRLSSMASIPNKVLRHRIKTRQAALSQNGLKNAKLWLGLHRLPVQHLGAPRQTSTGVRVGGREFKGAYLAYYKSNKDSFGVYERLNHLDNKTLNIMRQRGHKSQKRTTVDYTNQAFAIRASIRTEAKQWFLTAFRRELSFLTTKEAA